MRKRRGDSPQNARNSAVSISPAPRGSGDAQTLAPLRCALHAERSGRASGEPDVPTQRSVR
jgi:hypothetical protein